MDLFSHFAWTYLLFFRHRQDYLEGLTLGILPDVLFVAAALLYSINLFARTRQISRQRLFPQVRKVYLIGHSMITAIIVGIVASILNGAPYFPILGWILHILMDIYTHKGSPAEPQMPLYPLKTPAIKGFIWWRNPIFLIINWILIALVYFFGT